VCCCVLLCVHCDKLCVAMCCCVFIVTSCVLLCVHCDKLCVAVCCCVFIVTSCVLLCVHCDKLYVAVCCSVCCCVLLCVHCDKLCHCGPLAAEQNRRSSLPRQQCPARPACRGALVRCCHAAVFERMCKGRRHLTATPLPACSARNAWLLLCCLGWGERGGSAWLLLLLSRC